VPALLKYNQRIHMNQLSSFIKKFDLNEGFNAPTKLVFEDIVATPLARTDVDIDLAAVNANMAFIRKTRGGSWPEGKTSREDNLVDLAWHERELRENDSFAYAIYDTRGTYIGCFYLYKMGYRTGLDEALTSFDVDASWWTTQDAYDKGYYAKAHKALQKWLEKDFPFRKPYFSNTVIPK
jgi:hypothetical protein